MVRIIKNPTYRFYTDIIIIIILGLLTFYFYGINHTCQELYDIKVVCPCADDWDEFRNATINKGLFNDSFNHSIINQSVPSFEIPT
jgi:hypothetical protein